jgi:hypothetical protein
MSEVSEHYSILPCMFCGHKHLTLSDRYTWGPVGRAGVKTLFKKLAYMEEENLFREAFSKECLTILEVVRLYVEGRQEDEPDRDIDMAYEIQYAIDRIEDLEDMLLEHAGARYREEHPGEDEALRICPLCYDRAMVAKDAKAVFKLFR